MKRKVAITFFSVLMFSLTIFADAKKLNNVVSEIINIRNPRAGKVYKFELKDSHFVWIRVDCKLFSYSKVKVLLDDRKAIIKGNARRCPNFAYNLPEAMIYLSAGQHKVRIIASDLCELDRLRIHLVPEIHDYVYVEDLVYLYNRDSYRAFRWDWLKANGLLNYNVLATMKPFKDKSAIPLWEKRVGWWKSQSRRVIFNTGLTCRNKPIDKVEQCTYEVWKKLFSNSLCDGVIIDELVRNKWTFDRIPYWLKAAERITNEYKDKEIIFFSFTSYDKREDYLLKTIPQIDRVYLAPEHYFPEHQMDEFDSWSGGNMRKWISVSSKIPKECIIYLGCGNASTYAGYDTRYDIDYKAFLDRYVKYFAVDGKCFDGIRGIGFWKFNFLDEETYRYISALMRHYCILGREGLFYKEPLRLRHIRNGSFEDDVLAPWEIRSEVPGQIEHIRLPIDKTSSWLRVPFGKKGLRIKLGGDAVISQNVKDLVPGKIYQVECYVFSLEHKDIYPVEVNVEGADVIRRMVEVSTKRRCVSTDNRKSKIVSYWNRFRLIFRANGSESVLSIKIVPRESGSDKLKMVYIDFVQVQPYFTGKVYW